MKTAIVGDVHLKPSNKELVDQFFGALTKRCRDDKIERVIFLGDLYNQRALIRSDLQKLLIRRILAMHNCGVKRIDIVVGNHDLESLESHENSLEVLGWMFPGLVNVHTQPAKDGTEAFIPYTRDNAKVGDFLESLDGHTVYCHLPITGFLLAPKMKESNGIPECWFQKAKKVWAGHFHLRQDQGIISYPGSVLVNSFSESGMRPCIVVDGEYEDVKKMVPAIPLYFTTKVEGSNPVDVEWDNNCHKFVIHAPTFSDCVEIKTKMMEEAKKYKPVSVQFQYVIDKLEPSKISENLSPQEMFIQYMDNHTPCGINKKMLEDVKKRGLEYMEKFRAFI